MNRSVYILQEIRAAEKSVLNAARMNDIETQNRLFFVLRKYYYISGRRSPDTGMKT